MLRHVIGGFVLGTLVTVTGATFAQAPAVPALPKAPAAPVAKPVLTETENLMVQYVQVSDQLAACKQQLGTKTIVDLGASVKERIEAAHPGFTVDWKTGALVAKPPVK